MENNKPNLLSATSVEGKFDASLLVSGELYNSGYSLFGTEVSLFENDVISQKFTCCLNGFFYFKLDYEKQYKIVVSKADFQKKTILFNTNLFGSLLKKRFYEFGISLSPNKTNDQNDNEETATAIVNYIPIKESFEHDLNYSKQRQLKYKKAA
jgi:hypothetical protein